MRQLECAFLLSLFASILLDVFPSLTSLTTPHHLYVATGVLLVVHVWKERVRWQLFPSYFAFGILHTHMHCTLTRSRHHATNYTQLYARAHVSCRLGWRFALVFLLCAHVCERVPVAGCCSSYVAVCCFGNCCACAR